MVYPSNGMVRVIQLHLLYNEKGESINLVLTTANVDDRNEKHH